MATTQNIYFSPEHQLEAPEKTFTASEVNKHNTKGDLWIVLYNFVYDITKFLDFHPAGKGVLLDYAGQDCTKLFKQFHSETVLFKYHSKFVIGRLSDKVETIAPILAIPGTFGQGIPYGDPSNLQGWKSPYYKESHRELRTAIREYLVKEFTPYVDEWDANKKIPIEKIKDIAMKGCFALMVGQPYPEKYFPTKEINGIKVENFDYFHELVVIEESAKLSSNGVLWALGTMAIGLPPILKYGSDFIKDRYASQVLHGDKLIALAVTEPWAGSDVAGIKTTAKLSECGKFYIVNGMKKFITTGHYADCFTTAVRTDDDKYFGVSLLIIDRNMPGVKTRAMNMQGVWGSGTAFITFENVKVPIEHLIGDEGCAFLYIMSNFNHERFGIIGQCLGSCRQMLEESMKYAHVRDAFGKRLIDQPVIRQKLATIIKETETLQALAESVTYNFQNMTDKHDKVMAGAIGIAKAHATLVLEKVTNEALQIFGGNGYQRGSVGARVERMYRDNKSLTLGGGTPEIMMDLSVRMTNNLMPKVKSNL